MKVLALSMLGALALLTSGCGDSSSTTTVSGSDALTEQLRPIANEMSHSPTTIAYERALKAFRGDEDPPDLRRHIEKLLPKMTAYVRYVRSLHFPSCARSLQHGLTKLLHRSESMTGAAIPVLETGDEALTSAYLEKVHEVSSEESAALEKFSKGASGAFEEGDDVTC